MQDESMNLEMRRGIDLAQIHCFQIESQSDSGSPELPILPTGQRAMLYNPEAAL